MYYYFYSTDLIKFIFSYTQCRAIADETFGTFWRNFTTSLPHYNIMLDFGKYYHCNHYGPYDTAFDELQDLYPEFIKGFNHAGSNILYLTTSQPYDPNYATNFLDSLKKVRPTTSQVLIRSLLGAIDSIKDGLSYFQ